MTLLPADALEALANAHLLRVMPGTITGITVTATEVLVESSLPSPFTGTTPSRWLGRFSRVDGHTVALDVTETSQRIPGQERHLRDAQSTDAAATPTPEQQPEASHTDTTLTGTVVGPTDGLPGFVDVTWSDGRTEQELIADVTVID